jgi:hypothetical protein
MKNSYIVGFRLLPESGCNRGKASKYDAANIQENLF